MKDNGDIKKYFDALNRRFDALNQRLDSFEKRVEAKFEASEERLDVLAVEVGDLKLKVNSLNQLTTDMLKVQQLMIMDITDVRVRVKRLEDGQKRIIVLLTKLAERVSDLDSGKKFELREVHHDAGSQTLTGIIREPKAPYRTKKRKRKT